MTMATRYPPVLVYPDMDARLEQAAQRSGVPEHMRCRLVAYVRYGAPPGAFLKAVLSNDLREACRCADDGNRHALFEYVSFLWYDVSADCWGSPELYRAWIQRGRDARAAMRDGT